MLKGTMLNGQLKLREQALAHVMRDLEEMKERTLLALRAVDEADTEEKVDEADKTLASLQKELEEKEQEKKKIEDEIAEIKKELEDLSEKAPQPESEERKDKKTMEHRTAFENFLRRKENTEGLKSTGNEALIPVEIMQPHEAKQDESDLTSIVNVIKVNTASGKMALIKKVGAEMHTVEELAENPTLATPTFTNVKYEIATYRGHLPVSQELIDDADYDIMGLVGRQASNQERITKNKAIAKVLKTATQKEAAGFDGLKDVLNKDLKTWYNASIIASQSLFAALDKVTDKTGRYMLQPDPTSPTGYTFAGRTIYVFPDTVIADKEGDLKAFVGDVAEFVTLFDRAQSTVQWTAHNIYGDYLATAVRFDVQKVDEEAGFYVTYTDKPLA